MNDARYSLIIGINGYKPAIGQLRFCAHDARRVDDALKMQRVGFATTESILFTDEDEISPSPTRVNIMESVMHLCDKSNYKDTVLIFFSGHGTVVADDELYLLPIDASPAIIEQSAIAWKWLRDKIEQAPAKNKILILDACHSGAGRDIASDVRTSFKIVNQIEKNKGGFVCLTSCSAGQLSYELPNIEQGIFSYHLTNGLNGAADRLGRGVIEIESLYEFVRARTIQHARQIGVEQVPHLISRIASPLSTFVISSAASDRPIRHVLVLTEDPLMGKFIELGIERSAIARTATWVSDIETVKAEIHSRFDYDAIYIDVDNEWSRKKEFILTIRDIYPTVPFVLVGTRKRFLHDLKQPDEERFRHYFFFDIDVSLSQAKTLLWDTLSNADWYLRSGYGKNRRRASQELIAP